MTHQPLPRKMSAGSVLHLKKSDRFQRQLETVGNPQRSNKNCSAQWETCVPCTFKKKEGTIVLSVNVLIALDARVGLNAGLFTSLPTGKRKPVKFAENKRISPKIEPYATHNEIRRFVYRTCIWRIYGRSVGRNMHACTYMPG